MRTRLIAVCRREAYADRATDPLVRIPLRELRSRKVHLLCPLRPLTPARLTR
jgi:hypothetical protein